jgi:beta-N-acetylhexosaminidase
MAWPPGEAAVKALVAGNDLLLMPPDVGAAHAGIVAAVKSGALPRERLVEAATRVLTLRFGLMGAPRPELSALASAGHVAAVRPAAAAAITMLRGNCGTRPVGGKVTVTAAGGRDTAKANLIKALRAAGVEVVDSGGAVVHLVGWGDKQDDLSPDAAVTVAMDTPALLGRSSSKVLLATYSSSPLSMAALADVLAGQARPAGRSPIAVPGLPRTTCR